MVSAFLASITVSMSGMSAPQHNPVIIAHRGASGYLPEHTLPAYAMAHGQGADMIEPDVVMTRDDVLICNHDLTLERTTNVEAVFPDRKREDGKWYVVDFTWAEIQRLTVDGPRRPGEALWNDQIRKARLSDMIGLVQTMNRRTGQQVGIIPEPKSAAHHAANGKDLILALHQELARHGYIERNSGCVIQSFEEAALRRLQSLDSALPRVYLISSKADLERVGGLSQVKRFASGIGPRWAFASENQGGLIREAKAEGLSVYPWTFDQDVARMRQFLAEYRVDGLFTDFPDAGRRAFAEALGR